jgi:hypothetical protein
MSNFDDIREWLEKMNKDGEPKYKRFNIWLPIDKLPIDPSDVITHRAVPDETQVKVWMPTEYFEKYRRGYQAFKKNKEKEQNND